MISTIDVGPGGSKDLVVNGNNQGVVSYPATGHAEVDYLEVQ